MNTVNEIKNTFGLIRSLSDNVTDSLLRVMTALLIVGKLMLKPIEIVIAILRDIENHKEKRRLRKMEKAGSKKDSASSLCFA